MKKGSILLFALLIVLLSGCAAVDNMLETEILDKSAIQDDADYKTYVKMEQNGQLNENGTYVSEELDESEPSVPENMGKVHVTLAENRFLNIRYYSDAELTEVILNSECYLNPGDSIFAEVESKNTISNLYGISYYRILEYDTEGKIKNQFKQSADSNLVYTIPQSFSGNELSIIPIGDYPDRNLSMKVYYIDDSGVKVPLSSGHWYVNGDEKRDNKAAISPIVSYALKYEFDDENYFFVSSNPSCFTAKPDQEGFVEFWEANPTDEDSEYAVELHPYLKLTLSFDENATVSLNGTEAESIKKGKTWSHNKLQYGDVIEVLTAGKIKLSAGDYKHVYVAKDPVTEGYRYMLSLQQAVNSNASDVIDIDEYIRVMLPQFGAHGTCAYRLDGKPVGGSTTLQLSQTLTVTYTITDSNFKFEAEGIEGAWQRTQDFFANMSMTKTIPITPSMNETVFNPDAWFNIVPKGA